MSATTSSRGWIRATRIAAGALAAAGVAVAVVFAVGAPLPTLATEPVAIDARPGAADSTVACPGPLLAAGRNPSAAAEISVAAQVDVAAGAAAGREAVEPSVVDLATDVFGGSTSPSFVAAPVDGVRTDVAAAQSGRVASEDLVGFAASACTAPQFESWIVGGSTLTGETGLLLLSNPSQVAASVDISVFGPEGEATPPGGAGLTVAPGRQTVLSLAGLAGSGASPVLRIQSTGAPIAAALESSSTSGLVPQGLDVVGPAAPPAATQVVTGVVVPESATPDVPPTALVRMVAPTAAGEAQARVAAYDDAGREVANSGEVALSPGVPAEVTLADLPAGILTIRVESDVPVVTAASTRAVGDARDLAWFASTESVSGVTVFAVASGPSPVLEIVSDDGQARDVALVRVSDGTTAATIAVPENGAARVAVTQRDVYALDAAGPVRASLAYSGAGVVGGYPIAPAAEAASIVRVVP